MKRVLDEEEARREHVVGYLSGAHAYGFPSASDFVPVDVGDRVDIHHNFVARERWFGRDVYVHRKGAVAVPLGTRALIPGSMGTASYLVEGLGNEDSFGSCSHGAGRVMSRKEARAGIRPEVLKRIMRRVVYPEHLSAHLVEEAPGAYRDISELLEDQEDLVRRRLRLEPVAVLKGCQMQSRRVFGDETIGAHLLPIIVGAMIAVGGVCGGEAW